jgi:DNA replication protein DnaC
MLSHPTLDLLADLGLQGCAKAFRDLEANPTTAAGLSHAEWLAVLLEHEITLRRQKRFEMRAKRARLRHDAVLEDVDYHSPRGLDRTVLVKLGTCQWIREHRNLILCGPTGIGKSWLACALGQKACREDLSVLYYRVPRLFAALALGRGDGRYAKLLRTLAQVDLLILDDWGPEPLNADQRRDLLEIVEDRYGRGSLLITSQAPTASWHAIIGDPTLADAILDRIVHNAYRIDLAGDSLRKQHRAATPA